MKYRYRVLALLFLLAIITYLDRICIAVAGPRIQEDLHLTPEAWGWVVGVFVIAYGAFEIPSGYMGDRIQPVLAVVCLDVAPRHAGAVTGSMNTIVQVGSFLSSVLFGYFVTASGSYDLPLIPMAVILLIGAALWLKVDPTKELVPEQRPALAA
ncbi:MAG TPA: MFS transporter [Blastocatellia bacterium]|nr:MFS transporter [Blastocatellia bacterium]